MSAEDQKSEELQFPLTDPDPNRLAARMADKLIAVATAQGFIFKEDMLEEEFAVEIAALVYKYFDDETGGDSEYNPDEAPDSTMTSETGEDSEDIAQPSEEEEDSSEVDNDGAGVKLLKRARS